MFFCAWVFFFDHLIIMPYNKIMQINLNVIKTVCYSHEAVIVKKISSESLECVPSYLFVVCTLKQ